MTLAEHHGFGASSTTRLFTILDVARLAGVSVMTVRRWIDHQGLRVHRLGRLVRISQADLDAFLAKKRDDQEINSL